LDTLIGVTNMKTYEVCLKINGQKSVQMLDEERLSSWAEPVDWKVAIDFAIELAREQVGMWTKDEPHIDFEYIKEYKSIAEPNVGYVYEPTLTIQ